MPLPGQVPPSWYCTTSAVYRPRKAQAYCSLLPILGFVVFPSITRLHRTDQSQRPKAERR
jgi:hypothetical protein